MSVGEGERVESRQASERRGEQLRRLAASALLINSTVEIDELLAVITAQARETIGAHQAVTSLTVEDGSQAVTSVAATEKHAAWRDAAYPLVGAELVGLVCRENRAYRLSREELDAQELAAAATVSGWLAAPLVSRDGRNIGIIQLADKEVGEFDGEDEAILVQLAQMASAALENARLYDDARRRADELAAIHRLAEAVAVASSLDQVFDVALEALEQALGVDRGSVVLFEDGGAIHFRAWRGLSERYRDAVEGRAPWKGHSDDPTPFVIDDVLADSEVAELHDAFRAEGIRSMALVPLVHAGTILGRFVLYADRPGAFSTSDVRLGVSMASHVAAAVERRRAVDELVESRNQLEAIFASVADGITAQNAAGRLVFANDAAAQLSGFATAEELIAAEPAQIVSRFEIFDETERPLPLDQLPGRLALATGREAERMVCYRLLGSGERRWSIVRATPLLDAEGRVELSINVFHDVTESKLAEQRLRFLSSASEALAGSLDVDATLGAIAELAVPALADYCLIDVLDAVGSLREVVCVHVDSEGETALRALRGHYPVLGNPAHPVARVVATGEPLVVLDQTESALDEISLDAQHRELYRGLAPTSFVAVPMVARGRTLGAISLGTSSSGRRLVDADVAIVRELAERAALALDNARLYGEAQAEVAERQRSEERLRFLSRASQVLAGSLDYETTLASVARLAVPDLADWCIVYESRPDGGITRLAVEHAGGQGDAVREVLDRHPLDPEAKQGVPAVLRSGEPELIVEDTPGRLTSDVADPGTLADELSAVVPTSFICAPLIARGRTIGAIALMTAESGRRYGEDDLEFAVELARRAAVAVDNALLYGEARESLAQLEAVLVSAPVGIGFWDRDLRFVRVNDALAEINELSPEEHVGRSLREVIPALADRLEPLYRRALETGEPIVHQESTSDVANALGGERHWLSSYFPVRTRDGETIGVGAVIMEVTDRERAQARLRFLGEASEILAASLDTPSTVAGIARVAVEGVVEGSSIFLVDGDALVRAGYAHVNPEHEELLGRARERFELAADSPHPVVRAFLRGEPELLAELPETFAEDLAAGDAHREIARRLAPRSAILVPLVSRGRILGMLTLWASQPGRLGEEELAVAIELSRRAAVALDRSKLYGEANETAALLQGVLTQMPSGLAIADAASGRLLLHNEQAEAIWRRTWTERTLGEHVTLTHGFHADGRRYEPDEWPLARAISSGETVTAEEIAIERGDGSRGVIEVSAAPVRDDEDEVVAGVVTFDDVTARHEADARLRESEERFRRLADTIPALVWMSDTTGGCTYFNRRWLEFTGRPVEQELGYGWYENVHPDDVAHVRSVDDESVARRAPFSIEFRLAHRDGDYRWVLDEGLPRFTATGDFAGHIGACVDIQERKLAEERQHFLADASAVLASSLDVASTLDTVAGLAVPRLADWCSIVLRDDDGSLETVAVAHSDAAKVAAVRELQDRMLSDPATTRGAAGVIRSGELELTQDSSREVEPDRVLGLRSSLVVPLTTRERTIGALTLATSRESGRTLSEDDVELAQLVARRAAIAVDNARLYTEAEYQRALLRDAQMQLRSAISAAAIGTWAWDIEEDRFVADEFIAHLFAVDPAVAAAGAPIETFLRAVHRDDVAGVRKAIELAMESGDEFSADYRVCDADGELRWLLARGRVELAPDGTPVRFAGAAAEITERRLASERLAFLARASDELATLDYREALRSVARLAVPILGDFCLFDLQNEDTGALERVAAAHVDADGGRLLEPVPAGEYNEAAVAIRTAEPVLALDTDAATLTAPTGAGSVLSVPLLVGQRAVGALTFVFAESNQRHRPEDLTLGIELARRAALAVETARLYAETEARAHAAQALEFVRDGVFLVDADGRVALWNPAAAAITGIPHDEVVGRSADEALVDWPLDRIGDRTETHPVEVESRELWLSLSAVQFADGTVYAFRDLTEEHAVERLKSDFVSTVSHELRTPLAAIYGAAMTLQRTDVALAQDQRVGLLGVVATESERLARIVNDVLWASRLDSGVLSVSIESCDAAALTAAVVNAARVHLPANVELVLELEPDLPQVAADPDKVRQVLVNLVDNAIKYSPDGGLVEVRVAAAEHAVRFSVQDRGLGIPTSEHGRIFEKFFRLDPNLTRGVGGTGLGLYICRELVRRMNGRIWVDSDPGAGSTFAFELPVAGL